MRIMERAVASALAASAVVLLLLGDAGAASVAGEDPPAPGDSRQSMLREAMLGMLPGEAGGAESEARTHCLELPVGAADDRLQGPHGASLVSTRCDVVAYQRLGGAAPSGWAAARYRWTTVFTAEDSTRGPDARDTVGEEEAVLFELSPPGQVRPVWHARFETGPYAIWRSVTPEIAPSSQGTTLFSVMSCVNGAGGCGQEFLHRHPDGSWHPVRQDWFDQLPRGYPERIRHGVRIDPQTLRGEAGFYSAGDANCCPSQRLVVRLELRGDALVLLGQDLLPAAGQ